MCLGTGSRESLSVSCLLFPRAGKSASGRKICFENTHTRTCTYVPHTYHMHAHAGKMPFLPSGKVRPWKAQALFLSFLETCRHCLSSETRCLPMRKVSRGGQHTLRETHSPSSHTQKSVCVYALCRKNKQNEPKPNLCALACDPSVHRRTCVPFSRQKTRFWTCASSLGHAHTHAERPEFAPQKNKLYFPLGSWP